MKRLKEKEEGKLRNKGNMRCKGRWKMKSQWHLLINKKPKEDRADVYIHSGGSGDGVKGTSATTKQQPSVTTIAQHQSDTSEKTISRTA